MSKKIRHSVNFISFVIFLACLNFGCENSPQNSGQTEKEHRESLSLTIPQYELIETPEYKELKQQVTKVKIEVSELENQRNILLAKYTEQYPSVKKITGSLKDAKQRLRNLESLLADETERLEKRPKNSTV